MKVVVFHFQRTAAKIQNFTALAAHFNRLSDHLPKHDHWIELAEMAIKEMKLLFQ